LGNSDAALKTAAIVVTSRKLVRDPGLSQFKLKAIERAYNRIETRSAIDQIASFLAANLNAEALRVMGNLFWKRPGILTEIVKRGVFGECLYLNSSDGLLSLNFLHSVFDHLRDFREIAAPIGLAAVRIFASEGNDRMNSKTMATLTIGLLRKCDGLVPETTEKSFSSLMPEAQLEVNRLLEKCQSKRVVKKVSLVTFAATSRRKVEEGGWQTLD
jgi:hypothetical protein